MSKSQIISYIFFQGQCEEAIRFYEQAIGAKVLMLMRFSESPDEMPPGMLEAGFENKVMHAAISVSDTPIFLSDGCDSKPVDHSGIRLALSFNDPEQVHQAFKGLSQGGTVEMEPQKTFWSPLFGMVRDPFGVGWMVSIADESSNPGCD